MDAESIELLRKYRLLPKVFKGQELVVEFVKPDDFHALRGEQCDALGVDLGASIRAHTRVSDMDSFWILAEKDVAQKLLEIPEKARVKARVVTMFGLESRAEYTDEGSVTVSEVCTGLLLREIVNVTPRPKIVSEAGE